jgi:hypothetical protein
MILRLQTFRMKAAGTRVNTCVALRSHLAVTFVPEKRQP